jgi:hypothetical protein
MINTGKIMRIAALVLLVGLLRLPAGVAADSHRAFAGTWTMDPERSESAHQAVPTGASTLVIRLTEGGVSMETIRTEDGKPAAFHETLKFRLDGSETASTGDGEVTVMGKAHWDGAKLVIETVRNIQNSTVTTLYIHTLSPNGRELNIDKTLTVQHGYQGASAPTTGHGKDVFVRAAK